MFSPPLTFKLLLAAPLVLAVLVFTAQNAGVVDVRFFGWSFPVSLALVIFAALGVGFVAGWVMNSALRFRKRTRKD